MVEIDAKMVAALRKRTGAPMMDCKAALRDTGGDMDAAVDWLRKHGLQTANNRADKDVTEGQVFSYVHHNGKLGVLVEIGCETDFVARNEEFQQFGTDLCLHVAAMNPAYLNESEIDEASLGKEREILFEMTRSQMQGKPDDVVAKAAEGRLKKYLAERCLMDQQFVKDDKKTVEEVRKELVARIGENIQVRRFVRVELGG
ncbi:MAG: translation elongation factor Ts [Planctomycetes bacterium]|nr:translation elongation factor Ts [Planctomycetota bacterium]